jgi:hypothetical protein
MSPYTHTSQLNYRVYPFPLQTRPPEITPAAIPPLLDAPVSVPPDLYPIVVPLRILLSVDNAELLLSNKAALIDRIGADYGAHVHMLPLTPGALTRVLVLRAQLGRLQYILSQLVLLFSRPVPQRSTRMPYLDDVATRLTALTLLISMTSVGAIIGPGGATINATRSATGCSIRVSTAVLPRSTEKSVSIGGQPSRVFYAFLLIMLNIVAATATKRPANADRRWAIVLPDLTDALRPASPYEPECVRLGAGIGPDAVGPQLHIPQPITQAHPPAVPPQAAGSLPQTAATAPAFTPSSAAAVAPAPAHQPQPQPQPQPQARAPQQQSTAPAAARVPPPIPPRPRRPTVINS